MESNKLQHLSDSSDPVHPHWVEPLEVKPYINRKSSEEHESVGANHEEELSGAEETSVSSDTNTSGSDLTSAEISYISHPKIKNEKLSESKMKLRKLASQVYYGDTSTTSSEEVSSKASTEITEAEDAFLGLQLEIDQMKKDAKERATWRQQCRELEKAIKKLQNTVKTRDHEILQKDLALADFEARNDALSKKVIDLASKLELSEVSWKENVWHCSPPSAKGEICTKERQTANKSNSQPQENKLTTINASHQYHKQKVSSYVHTQYFKMQEPCKLASKQHQEPLMSRTQHMDDFFEVIASKDDAIKSLKWKVASLEKDLEFAESANIRMRESKNHRKNSLKKLRSLGSSQNMLKRHNKMTNYSFFDEKVKMLE